MKKQSKIYSGIAIMAMALTMATTPFVATDTLATNKTVAGMHTNEEVSMKGGYSILGSKFIGMEVENAQGENL